MIRTRFAPSPTGELHLGGASIALASFVAGDVWVLRVEDLDTPRVVAGAIAQIEADLRWLGLSWEEGPAPNGWPEGAGTPYSPYVQSARTSVYEAALTTLEQKGLLYPCDCSRAEIARESSAPHAGEDVFYAGTCRVKNPQRAMKRPPAWRIRVPTGQQSFFDRCRQHTFTQDLAREVGDFVVKRADGLFAYQLATALDDAAMDIDVVLRGGDLLKSTARQLWLQRELGYARHPHYGHVGLVLGPDGNRLEKRHPQATVGGLRAQGVTAEILVGTLAYALGIAPSTSPIDPAHLRAQWTRQQANIPWKCESFAPIFAHKGV